MNICSYVNIIPIGVYVKRILSRNIYQKSSSFYVIFKQELICAESFPDKRLTKK